MYMAEKHLGRTEIAMCDREEGVHVRDLFEMLELVAPTVAEHSRNLVAAFLSAQPKLAIESVNFSQVTNENEDSGWNRGQ